MQNEKIVYVDMDNTLVDFAYKRLILSHHKNLLMGDYLIDDRIKTAPKILWEKPKTKLSKNENFFYQCEIPGNSC